jgi:hypothetical protein
VALTILNWVAKGMGSKLLNRGVALKISIFKRMFLAACLGLSLSLITSCGANEDNETAVTGIFIEIPKGIAD